MKEIERRSKSQTGRYEWKKRQKIEKDSDDNQTNKLGDKLILPFTCF